MKHIKTFESFLNENLNESENSPQSLADFIKKNEKHFSTFLKPKSISVSVDDDICTIEPESGSFTITVDFKYKKIESTGKPSNAESTSYVEIMEYIKGATKFFVITA